MVGTDATWPPMEYIDEDTQQLVGFDIELFKALSKVSNLAPEFKVLAWDGIFEKLDSGEVDVIVSSVTINEERKRKYDFSMPYVNAGQVIITRFNDTSVRTMKDLVGKKVGAQKETTGAAEIEKLGNVKLELYDDILFAVEELDVGRIDAVICDVPIAADYVLRNVTFRDTLKIATKPFTNEYYGIVVKKGNKELLDKINMGLLKIIDNGTVKKLEDKWLH